MTTKKPFIIGISGPTASGKTLLVSNLLQVLQHNQPAVLKEDAYYKNHPELTYIQRTKLNFDHPDAYEHDLLIKHLKHLQQGHSVQTPDYDFKKHLRINTTTSVTPSSVILLDGILILNVKEIRELIDLAIFIDTPLDICLLRRFKRDYSERERSIDQIIEQYQASVRPMHKAFVSPSKEYADIIVTGGGNNWAAIDLIKSRIQKSLTLSP